MNKQNHESSHISAEIGIVDFVHELPGRAKIFEHKILSCETIRACWLSRDFQDIQFHCIGLAPNVTARKEFSTLFAWRFFVGITE